TKREERKSRSEKRLSAENRNCTGKSTLLFAEPAVEDGLIGIDAAVAQERPVAARVFALGGVALDNENFFVVVRGFGDDLPKGVGHERIAPELQAGIAILRLAFETHAIDDGSVNAVGDGVATLDSFPRVELRGAELRFFVGMPANAGGIKNHVRAAKSGEARTFGVPLVPANLHADARVFCIEIREAEITRREIKLFVIERIVGNVHFAV